MASIMNIRRMESQRLPVNAKRPGKDPWTLEDSVGGLVSALLVALSTRAAFMQGMNPRIFVVYRQAIATLVIVPLAFFMRSKTNKSSLGLRSFSLIFLASLTGVTLNQNIDFEGLYLASSSMASAISNLLSAVTFVITLSVGIKTTRRGNTTKQICFRLCN
ncbi:WAT1-related protein At4g28040-like isoform X2 [Apium graveolens]|uniref:WAT1-related protein At4g28040-like isoform X2 n=1 Tax=Apium graveolens TaxID=4045 RepID=UPI003D794D97